ncbi:MAG: hypothetical protein ACRDQA_24400 [Nocardioidaceae bacterium]
MSVYAGTDFARWYWTIWGLVTIPSFLAYEIYTLTTNVYNTLSWTLWHLEDFTPGQGVTHWTAAHFLIGGLLLLLLVWLMCHLVFGLFV